MNRKYAIAAVLIAAMATVGCSKKDDPSSTATPTPVAVAGSPSPSPQASVSRAPRNYIQMPLTFGGRDEATEYDHVGVPQLVLEEKIPTGSELTGKAWGSKAKKNLVSVSIILKKGATAMDLLPALAAIPNHPGFGQPKLTLDKGAGCGDIVIQGLKHAICAWADEKSVGIAIWYAKRPADVKAEFAQIRKSFVLTV